MTKALGIVSREMEKVQAGLLDNLEGAVSEISPADPSTMQGALQSGLRATREVHAAIYKLIGHVGPIKKTEIPIE